MQTIMLCCFGVFSTAMRWSPTRLMQAERSHRLAAVLEQRALERRIAPGLGDDAGAVVRADLGLVGLDDDVERGRVDIALLGQHGLERAHAQLHLGQLRAVLVMIVMIVVMILRHGVLSFPALCGAHYSMRGSHEKYGRTHRRQHRPRHCGHRPRRDLVLPLHRAGRVRRGGDALCARHRLDPPAGIGALRPRRPVHARRRLDAAGRRPRARRHLLCAGQPAPAGRSSTSSAPSSFCFRSRSRLRRCRCLTSARSWAIFEGSRETSGLPFVYLLKTLIPLFALLIGLQGIAQAIRAALVLGRAARTMSEFLAVAMVVAVCALLLVGYPVALTLAGVSLGFAGIGRGVRRDEPRAARRAAGAHLRRHGQRRAARHSAVHLHGRDAGALAHRRGFAGDHGPAVRRAAGRPRYSR